MPKHILINFLSIPAEDMQNILTVISIVFTIIFSILLYRLDKRSNETAKNMERIEKDRDRGSEIKNSTIIYYNTIRIIEYLYDLIYQLEKKNSQYRLKNFTLDNHWISILSDLRGFLSYEEIDKLRKFFEDFEEFQSRTKNDTEKIKEELEFFANQHLNAHLLENVNLTSFDKLDSMEIIPIELFIILSKINMKILEPHNIQDKSKDKSLERYYLSQLIYSGSECLFEREFKLYNMKGEVKFEGSVENGIIYGQYFGYDKGKLLYAYSYTQNKNDRRIIYNHDYIPFSNRIVDEEFDLNIKEWKGIKTLFNKPFLGLKKVLFHGDMTKGNLSGEGYSTMQGENKILLGYWEGYEIKNGSLYSYKNDFRKNKILFKGTFKYNSPYSGECIGLDIEDEFLINFTGNILEGKPLNGQGSIFNRDNRGRKLDDLKEIRQMEEAREEQDIALSEDEKYHRLLDEGYERRKIEEAEYWMKYVKVEYENGIVVKEGTESNYRCYDNNIYEEYDRML